MLGGAGVHPEHSFSMAWPCSLSFVWFLPSAADEPAKEENHYDKDGCNAINREGLLGEKLSPLFIGCSYNSEPWHCQKEM